MIEEMVNDRLYRWTMVRKSGVPPLHIILAGMDDRYSFCWDERLRHLSVLKKSGKRDPRYVRLTIAPMNSLEECEPQITEWCVRLGITVDDHYMVSHEAVRAAEVNLAKNLLKMPNEIKSGPAQ